MQAYMKSELPFLGVQRPAQKQVYEEVFAAHPLASFDEWRATVLTLWREAAYREERYAAIALAADRRYRDHRTLHAFPLFEELVVTGAWWDFVDATAGLVGELLRSNPEPVARSLRGWSRADDRWKRRVSIISQLGFKAATDLELLRDCIEANCDHPDFFVRKAIGWALREYSKTDGAWVEQFVADHHATLSPLSRREALKWLEHERREGRR